MRENYEASQLVAQAMTDIERIANSEGVAYADQLDMPKRLRQYRKMTMTDAKRIARHAATALRQAWELLDPVTPPTKDTK